VDKQENFAYLFGEKVHIRKRILSIWKHCKISKYFAMFGEGTILGKDSLKTMVNWKISETTKKY